MQCTIHEDELLTVKAAENDTAYGHEQVHAVIYHTDLITCLLLFLNHMYTGILTRYGKCIQYANILKKGNSIFYIAGN